MHPGLFFPPNANMWFIIECSSIPAFLSSPFTRRQELSEQIKIRMDMGLTEIPDELIQKAEIIVHQMSIGFRNIG